MVAMTTARLVVQSVLLSLHVYESWVRASPTSITVPDVGFDKGALEFIHVVEELEWAKAADVCQKEFGGYLARVNTVEEKDALLEFTTAHSVGNHFWIGMQWSNGQKVWNDGSCTPINPNWFHYKDSGNSVFSNDKQCFGSHDTGAHEWEAFACRDDKHFVCERRSDINTVDVNIDFYVILQNYSDKAVCESLCKTLVDCFLSSPILNACIVGIASNQPNTNVLVFGTLPGQTISTAFTSNVQAKNKPDDCVQSNGQSSNNLTTLSNYTIINGYWHDPVNIQATPTVCPSSQPLASTVYVTHTVTEMSVHVSVTTSPVEVNTCSTDSIQPTQVVQVMTTVVVETTTIPSYVTMTTHIEASSCSGYSTAARPTTYFGHYGILLSLSVGASSCSGYNTATLTTTVESCSSTSIPAGPISATSTQAAGVVSDTTITVVNSEIDELFRMELENLLLDKDILSKTIRGKNSADNKLFSSVAIGFSFSLMCTIFISVIILSDMRAILYHIYTRMWPNVRSFARFH